VSDRLIGHVEARAGAEAVLAHPGADAVEVVVVGSSTGVTRYARSEIIQNTAREELRVNVRVVHEGRSATAATTTLDGHSLARAADAALEAARVSPVDPGFPGLADPADVGTAQPLSRWDDSTAAAAPVHRARAVEQILRASSSDNAAGIFETSAHCYGIFSSGGIDCFDRYTRCMTTCLVDLGGATGWGESTSHRIDVVDPESAARTARAKADSGRSATDATPGTYPVVLEPSAVATMLEYLSYVGFGAKQVLEGESFLSRRTGEMVAAGGVTISDDAAHPLSIGIGFDLEGVPRTSVPLIERGRAVGPVTDRRTADAVARPLTGHFSGSNEYGPYASNVVLDSGDSSVEELVEGIDEGLLVTRFHYVNVLDRPSTLLTGMTRDGTFRISGGEVAGAVRNLRFAQSALGALAAVDGIGSEQVVFAPEYSSYGSTVAPALRVQGFTFASATSH